MKKILFVSVFEKGNGGGAGVVATELAEVFAQHKFEVYKLISGPSYSQYVDSQGVNTFTYKAITSDQASVSSLTIRNIKKIFFILDLIAPEIIHAHDCDPVAYIVQIWALLHNVAFVSTLHVLPSKALEFGIFDVIPKVISKFAQPNLRHYYKEYLGGCDGVIALNADIEKDIVEAGYIGDVAVIPNGRFLKNYHICSFTDSKSTTKTIGFVGAICKRKNQEFLIEVMKFLPGNYELILIGNYLNLKYKEQIIKSLRDGNIKNVKFKGQIDTSKVPEELENMHVFVSASKIEVLSLAVIEALASGTPVVALENETTRSLMPRSEFVLAQDSTAQYFAQKVQKICELSKQDYEKLCKQSRESVSLYDWENVYTQTLDFYNRVIIQHESREFGKKKSAITKILARIPSQKARLHLSNLLGKPSDVSESKPVSLLSLNKKSLFFAGLASVLSIATYLLLKNKNKK